ncbi:SpaA isopeptide-forming pilin-related protein [Bifidobacterium anseris]|nr:SpaA isopeptide-forming pilin-related protein [Bifidobacterium anseris]
MARSAAAIVAAAAMLAVGAVTASTAYAADDGAAQITINSPTAVNGNNMIAPSVNGRTFNAYELGSYEDVTLNAAKTAISGYSLKNANSVSDSDVMGWINQSVAGINLDSTLKDVMSCTGSGSATSCTFKGNAANLTPLQFVSRYFYGSGTDAYGNTHANQPLMRRFAQAAAGKLTTPSATVTGTSDDKVVFTNLPAEGLYLITEASTTAQSQSTIARAMVTGTAYSADGTVINQVEDTSTTPATTYDLGELYLKAEKVVVGKDVTDADGKAIKDELARAKSERTFTITTNVPNYDEYTNWTNPKFSITDAPTNLTLAIDSIKVTATKTDGSTPETTTLTKDTDYTVTPTDGGGFTVTLTKPVDLSGDSIKVTYTGVVTDVTVDTTTNKASVNFSNSPSDSSRHGNGSADDTKNIYVAALPLQKIKYATPATVLSGAVFAVTDTNGNPVNFDVNADGSVYSVDPTSTRANANQITSNTSSVELVGLGGDSTAPTTYTFTEQKAPTGYILGKTPVTFTLTVTPQYTANTMTGVAYKINGNATSGADFTNFVDSSDSGVLNGTVVTGTTMKTAADGTTTQVTTTRFEGSTIRVENTTNASDFAKTGGEITIVLAVVVALALIGAVCLIVARMRRNRA